MFIILNLLSFLLFAHFGHAHLSYTLYDQVTPGEVVGVVDLELEDKLTENNEVLATAKLVLQNDFIPVELIGQASFLSHGPQIGPLFISLMGEHPLYGGLELLLRPDPKNPSIASYVIKTYPEVGQRRILIDRASARSL